MPLGRGRLAFRLAAVYGLLSAVVLTTLGLGVQLLAERHLSAQAERDLSALADFYAAYAAAAAPDEGRMAALAPQIVSFFAPQAGYEVRLFSARTGALLAATQDSNRLPSSAAILELSKVRPTLYLSPASDQEHRRYIARRVVAAEGSVLAVVELSRDISDREVFLLTLRRTLLSAGGAALVVFLLASVWLARRMTRPLRQMESATRAIASGEFDRRLPVSSRDEIGHLAASINQMADDLARLEASRRDFIARISHDLRTPLTAIKGFVANLQETAPDGLLAGLATVDEQTDRLIRLVNELLTLTRFQQGQPPQRCIETDLRRVSQSAIDLVRERAQRLGIKIALEAPSDTQRTGAFRIRGDPDRLQQVVINLLDNAVRATPPGGQIRVQITPREDDFLVRVTDTGRGLSSEEAARAFEPYFRGEGGGTGLGLSIAQAIVKNHGGSMWLESRQVGGVEAGFTLPRYRQAADKPPNA